MRKRWKSASAFLKASALDKACYSPSGRNKSRGPFQDPSGNELERLGTGRPSLGAMKTVGLLHLGHLKEFPEECKQDYLMKQMCTELLLCIQCASSILHAGDLEVNKEKCASVHLHTEEES